MENTPSKHFWCKKDKHYSFSDEFTITDDIASAKCDICGEDILEVPHYYGNIQKAQGKQTGPKTAAGKKRSSLNNYKHGMKSRQLNMLAPAIADRYPECNGCEHKDACKNDTDFTYCPVIVRPMLEFVKAYQEGDVNAVKSFAGFTQARVYQILQIILKDIMEKGTLLPKEISTRFKTATIDGDGNPEEEIKEQVLEWQRNPLLPMVEKFMQILGITADQQVMTPEKGQDQSNTEGFIQVEKDKLSSNNEFEEKRINAIKDLKDDMRKAIELRKNDDVLKKFNQEEEDDKSSK